MGWICLGTFRRMFDRVLSRGGRMFAETVDGTEFGYYNRRN